MAVTRTAHLRIATRASKLARAQAEIVARALERLSGVTHSVVEIDTKGDSARDHAISTIGSDGVFVKELEAALLDDRADIAVHSLKDLPTEPTPGLDTSVVLERADARDVLISRDTRVTSLAELPLRAIVGTSSLRRRAQLSGARSDLDVRDIRGNVDTRVRKVVEGQFDAAVLALAGLERIGLLDKVARGIPLPIQEFVPAAGQGAIVVQRRTADERCASLIAPVNHPSSAKATALERSFLRALGGGCLAPIGVHASVDADRALVTLHAFIGSPAGDVAIRRSFTAAESEVDVNAAQMAREMLDVGGREIIAHARGGRA